MNTFTASFFDIEKGKYTIFLLSVLLSIQLSMPLLCHSQSHFQDNDFWKDITVTATQPIRTSPLPSAYRLLSLEKENFISSVQYAPLRFANMPSEVFISLPLADGTSETFKVAKASVFEEDLAKKFPELSSFFIESTTDERITGRINITTDGIYALVVDLEKGMTYIEPYSREISDVYIAYSPVHQGNEEQHEEFSCKVAEDITGTVNPALSAIQPIANCELRRFRITVSATGEYTQWHGGTVEQAMGKIMVLLSNATLMLEREIGITLELVDGNEQLIFLNPDTDPFTNDNKFSLLEENADVANAIIGEENFDLGMVVAIVGGGAALFNSVCNISRAKGAAGSTWSPEGYPLESTFLHELGHKFGASHTFNNSCSFNRDATASYETGSGSSVMSYAGACAPSVTYPRENYFHSYSLSQIRTYMEVDMSTLCGEVIYTMPFNLSPDAGVDRSIPLETSFVLEGQNTDFDPNSQTYSWEQLNKEIAPMPPRADINKGPSFRSFAPKNTPHRAFPSMECHTEPNISSSCIWEVLPEVPRTMNFDFVIRQINDGVGCWEKDDLELHFVDTGAPFAIYYPNGNDVLLASQTINVQWDVAQTNLSPINCPNVQIVLSIDNGQTFPYILSEETANDGAASVQLPDVESNKCYIKVVGKNHVFFDISDDKFEIKPSPKFVLSALEQSVSFCDEIPSMVSFELNVTAEEGFSEQVVFPVSDNTNNLSISFSPTIITPPGNVTIDISGDWELGENRITVTGTSTSLSNSFDLIVKIADYIPEKVELLSPTSNAIEVNFSTLLSWQSLPIISEYEVEVSDSPSFQNTIISTIERTNSLEITDLEVFKIYYWRVRALNACGAGQWSDVAGFRTKNEVCTEYFANNTPRVIVSNDYTDAYAIVAIEEDYSVSRMTLPQLVVEHTHVGDLSGRVIAPSGTYVELFYRPGYSSETTNGCIRDDLDLTFDDRASATYEEMWNTCESVGDAISGAFQPMQALSNFVETNSFGQWLINVNDLSPTNGGELQSVSINLCREDLQPDNNLTASNEILYLDQYEEKIIDENYISISDNNSVFQIIETPQNGTLLLDGNTLNIGDVFLQNDLINNKISYQNGGNAVQEDSFKYDASNAFNEWTGIKEFLIEIAFLAPVPTIYIANPLDCTDGSSAAIGVSVEFGTAPFMYSLDGENYQSENDFFDLPAGNYSVFVQDVIGYIVETEEIIIENPEVLSAELTTLGTMITVSATGGTGGYLYQLNDGDFQLSPVFSVPNDGSYLITVLDENGCTFETSTIVNSLTTTIGLTQGISCHNANDAGIFVETFGGMPPFQYKLNEGEYQDGNIFSNLGAGEYTVQILDAIGQEVNSSTIVIDNPAPIGGSVIVNGYELTVSVNNDLAPFIYNFNGNGFSSEATFIGAPTSEYEVVVQNAAGCTATFYAEITALPPVISSLIETPLSCHNDTDGKIIVIPFHGIAPYEYRMEGGDFQSSSTFSNLTSGIYTFDIRDSGGYISPSQTVELINPEPIDFSIQSVVEIITIAATGGTGDLSYSLDGIDFQPENIFTNIPTGVYFVSVKDENGCEETLEYIHNAEQLSVNTSTQILSPCDVDTPIKVTVCINGGLPPYDVTTTPIADIVTEMENEECSVFYELIYNTGVESNIEVVTNDANGTQFTNVLIVPELETLTFVSNLQDNNLSIIATSGTAPFQFSIDGENYQEGGFFPDLENGEYTVSVLDAQGCEAETTVLINYTTTVDFSNLDMLFMVYPNPATNFAEIRMNKILTDETSISVYDFSGKKIVFDNIAPQTSSYLLDLQQFSNGIYEIVIQQGRAIGRERLVVLK